MTCTMHGRGFESQIDDYVDRTLPAAAREALEAHLALCPACRALAADLAAIREAARTLDAHEPPPYVWSRLSASIESGRSTSRLGRWSWSWQPFASAAAGVVLVLGLSWIAAGLTPDGPAPSAAPAAAAAYPDTLAVAYRDAEEQYATAIAGLEEITTAEQGTLDPTTADVLQANLTVIDQAIVESRAALQSEPQSHVAQESLFEALRHKVALLQDTLALINEMRKGNEEGAARILSGLNP